MSHILDQARLAKTDRYAIDSIRPVEVDLRIAATGRESLSIDRSHEYVVTLSIQQNLWANGAQLEQARAYAVAAISRHLYRDVLMHLDHLRLAIESGDRRTAHELVNEIEKATRP